MLVRIRSTLGIEAPTSNVELGALVEQTKTLSARATTEQVGQRTGQGAVSNGGGVTSVSSTVAARELGLVAALVGGLLDSHVVGNRELDVAVTLVSDTVAGSLDTGGRRKSHDRGGKGNNSSSDGELHCDGSLGRKLSFFGETWRRKRDWNVKERLVIRECDEEQKITWT